ncbi:MAG: cytochrome c oxidase subunit II [Paracoccaceae bacterium]
MRLSTYLSGLATGLGATLLAAAALAQEVPILGRPVDKAMGFQPAATEIARDIQGLDHLILVIISAIVVFVTGLLIWVMIRYNAKSNPKPATFTHNSPLEVAWTIVPIVILVFIGAFSLPVLFRQMEIPAADITIKATGNQWFWSYEYVDEGIGFDSFMLPKEELVAAGYAEGDYLLATDTAVVLPVGKTIVIQTTGADVIHAWMVPSLGIQMSAVPGRLSELWFKADVEGVYFGQCTTLCGKDHAYMPITVKIVSEAAYAEWLAKAKVEYAGLDAAPIAVALAD